MLSFDQEFSVYEVFAPLRLNAPWAEWDIILLFEYKVLDDGKGAASLSIQSLHRFQSLEWEYGQLPHADSGLFVEGNDRMTYTLDGRIVSAKLKKGIHSECPEFKVTTTISAGDEELGSHSISESDHSHTILALE